MKQIPLTQGKFAIVDDEDYEYLNQWKWYAQKTPTDNYYYSTAIVDGRSITMHRLIMNASKGQLVDHKDRDGLNNQKSNLRLCTPSENQMNKIGKRNSSSKYKGVSLVKQKRRSLLKDGSIKERVYISWQSVININGKNKTLGRFKDEIQAALVYNHASKKHYGEFARLNVIN